MQAILSIILITAVSYAIIVAIKVRNWIAVLISLGFLLSALLRLLAPIALFYHSVALLVISTFVLILSILFAAEHVSARQRLLSLLIGLPLILVCSFKVFELQGISELSYGLYLSLAAFLFLTLDRRKWDHYWANLLFVTISALIILLP